MSAAAWFIAGWLAASVFIFSGIAMHAWCRARQMLADAEPTTWSRAGVYTTAELQRAAKRRQGPR